MSGKNISDLIARLPVSRRAFIGRVVGGAFVAPVISSVALPSVLSAMGGTPLQTGPGVTLYNTPFPSGFPCPSSASSSSTVSCGGDAIASADAYLRKDAVNTNEGGNIRLRVGVKPISRAVVQFDQNDVDARLYGVSQIMLVLTIAANHNTWGQTAGDHAVCAHPLTQSFIEGDGHQGLMPAPRVQRGSGPGATWRSPNDPDVMDKKVGPKRPTNVVIWDGGSYGPSSAAPVVHTNQMSGEIAFDVTNDVFNGKLGWLLKIDDERDNDRPLPPGDEPFVGVVEYYSVQGALDAGDITLAPRLQFS